MAEMTDSHHNEGDKIYRCRFILSLLKVFLTDAGRHTPVVKPQRAEENDVALEIPVTHGEGGNGTKNL